MGDQPDLRFRILMILSDNKGHTHTDISRLLGPKDKDRPGKKKGYDGYDKGDLTRSLKSIRISELIQVLDGEYFIVPSQETFSNIINNSIENESSDFLNQFLESEYTNSLIKSIGFKSIFSAIRDHFVKNRSFRDIVATTLLSHPATIEEYKGLPKSIENYFNSMEDTPAMVKVGKKFQKDCGEVRKDNPAYKWMEKAFLGNIHQYDGAPYSPKVVNIDELEILHDLGIQGVLFYRKHLLEDFINLFQERTNAENGSHIIEYVQLDNYLSPFTAYPVNHPIELLFSSSFGMLFEDAYLIEPKDMGILQERANKIFENFHEFARIYIGSRTYKEAAIRELTHDWNIAAARLEAILSLLGQLGYDPEKSCFHLTRDGTGFQIVNLRTDEGLLGESDIESLETSNLNTGFYEFDQTKFMRPVLLGSFGHGWQDQLVPIEAIIAGMNLDLSPNLE